MQFLDASWTIIREMHADAWNAAAAIALVEGMEWPAGAVRMVILKRWEARCRSNPGRRSRLCPRRGDVSR